MGSQARKSAMKKYSSVVIVIIVHSITHLVHFLIMSVIYHSLKTPSDLPSAVKTEAYTHTETHIHIHTHAHSLK